MQLMIDNDPQKNKNVWYLDTEENKIYKNKLLLRIKKEKGKVKSDLTLKCRNPDRYVAASYNLHQENKPFIRDSEYEFGEDIVPQFSCIYSTSSKCNVEIIMNLDHLVPWYQFFQG